MNRLLQESHPDGQVISYAYDGLHLQSKTITGPNPASVSYVYDARNLLVKVTDASGTITFYRDADGNPIEVSYPGGATEQMQYDANDALTRIWGSGSGGNTLTSYAYSYLNPTTAQPTDQRYQMTDLAGNVTNYAYDALDRLTSAVQTSSAGSQLASYSYGYDLAGNLTTETRNGTTTSMQVNGANELTDATTGGVDTAFVYDGNGNQTAAAGRLHAWYGALNQTSGLAGPGGVGMNTAYTGQGQTDRVAAGDQTFQYDATGLNALGSGTPLAASLLAASYAVQRAPASWPAGSSATVTVTVTNTSTTTWTAGGTTPVHLGLHFSSAGGGYSNGGILTDQRLSLPGDVPPGASVTLSTTVSAPSSPGNDTLEYQMEEDQSSPVWAQVFLDAPAPVTSLTASANPVVTAGTGSTTINWNSGDGSTDQVYVAADGGAETLFVQGPTGSASAPWINAGHTYVFTLYQGTGHSTVLDRVTVVGTAGAAVVASDTTEPSPRSSTTLAWATADGSIGQLYVSQNGAPEQLVAQGSSGPTTVSWLQPGSLYTFSLYAGTDHSQRLAQTTIGVPTISASPTITGTGTSTSTISWNSVDGSFEQVYVSVNGGPETLFPVAAVARPPPPGSRVARATSSASTRAPVTPSNWVP